MHEKYLSFQCVFVFFNEMLYYFKMHMIKSLPLHYLGYMAVVVKKKKNKSFSIILFNTPGSPVLIIQSIKPKYNLSSNCFLMQWNYIWIPSSAFQLSMFSIILCPKIICELKVQDRSLECMDSYTLDWRNIGKTNNYDGTTIELRLVDEKNCQ